MSLNVAIGVFAASAAWTIPRPFLAQLRLDFPQHVFREAWDRESLRRALVSADAAMAAYVDGDLVPSLTRLRWVQVPAAGVAHVLSRELVASPIVVTSARGIRAQAMAEHVVAVMFALARQLPTAFRRQAEHAWAIDELDAPGVIRTLHGKRLGIVGFGSIGTEVARVAAALGMRISVVRRRVDQPVPEIAALAEPIDVHPPEALAQVLAKSDVVVMAAASGIGAPPLIDAVALAAVKPGAFFINVARGRLVDDDALVAALKDGRLAGAALDVFTEEPVAASSPYWDLPNVIVTPHVSGAMEDYWTPLVALFSENLRRFDAGAPLLNVVDKNAGY